MERFQRFTVLITNITRSIRKIKTEEMARWNLKRQHVSCIYYLYSNGALTSKKLCDMCNEDKANISRTLDYLESEGFITTKNNSKKRYNAQYVLTEKGSSVGEIIRGRIDEILESVSGGISDEDRTIMYSCLETIYEKLCAISDEHNNNSL